MSKIYFLYLLIALIIPLLSYPQKKTFDELIKADIIKQSSVFKSHINFNKVYFFFIKRNRNSLNSIKESKSKERLVKIFKSQEIDVKFFIGLFTDFSLLQRKVFRNIQNKVGTTATFSNNYDAALTQKQIKAFNVEKQSNQSQMNDYFYLVIALSLLLLGGGFVYNKHVKGTNLILHQKSKLNELNDTKDKLLTIICHDLRSSVYALKDSNAQLTSSLENKNYEELDQLLHKNSTIANGAYSLLDNILHWALLQTKQLYFHKDSVHLFSIVQQIEYNFRPLFAEKALVFENAVSENCFIYVDLDSLKIILRNLLDNAIKFSNKNGKISVYTEETNSNFCKLIIEDTGKGIDQNSIAELLVDNELLCKKSNSEIIGTGLGVPLCKMMIHRNEGKLSIESELNKGTKMIISFPKTEQDG